MALMVPAEGTQGYIESEPEPRSEL